LSAPIQNHWCGRRQASPPTVSGSGRGWPEPSWEAAPTKYTTSRSPDRLEHEQLDDSGWDFHFLHYSPGQTVERRGLTTLAIIRTLRERRRI
jgi:hypothetical protein